MYLCRLLVRRRLSAEDMELLAALEVPQARRLITLRPTASREKTTTIGRNNHADHRSGMSAEQANRRRLSLPDLHRTIETCRHKSLTVGRDYHAGDRLTVAIQ